MIGETAVWRMYLHYRPDEAWLRSPAAAFTRTQAEAIAAETKGGGGPTIKQSLGNAKLVVMETKGLRALEHYSDWL